MYPWGFFYGLMNITKENPPSSWDFVTAESREGKKTKNKHQHCTSLVEKQLNEMNPKRTAGNKR